MGNSQYTLSAAYLYIKVCFFILTSYLHVLSCSWATKAVKLLYFPGMTRQKLAEQKKLQRLEQAWLEERDAEMWAISRVIPTFKPITLVVRYMMKIYLFLKFKVKHWWLRPAVAIIFKYGNGYNCLVNLPLPCK